MSLIIPPRFTGRGKKEVLKKNCQNIGVRLINFENRDIRVNLIKNYEKDDMSKLDITTNIS